MDRITAHIERQIGWLEGVSLKVKVTNRSLNDIPMTEPQDVTCYMGSQFYLLPDTSERAPPWFQPAGRCSIYLPRGMEGWVDLGYLAMQQPGVELATSRSQVRLPNHYTTEPLLNGIVMWKVNVIVWCEEEGNSRFWVQGRAKSMNRIIGEVLTIFYFSVFH